MTWDTNSISFDEEEITIIINQYGTTRGYIIDNNASGKISPALVILSSTSTGYYEDSFVQVLNSNIQVSCTYLRSTESGTRYTIII